jgi:hypothetical protein
MENFELPEESCYSHLTETYTWEEIQLKLQLEEALNAVHNHEVFIHGVTQDYAPLILGIINTLAIVYLIYKQNTNK